MKTFNLKSKKFCILCIKNYLLNSANSIVSREFQKYKLDISNKFFFKYIKNNLTYVITPAINVQRKCKIFFYIYKFLYSNYISVNNAAR